MNHVIAFIIKYVMIAAVLLIFLTWIFDVPFVDTLLLHFFVSFILTLQIKNKKPSSESIDSEDGF